MAYGSATTVQELAWGAAKANTPAGVTAALVTATSVINSKFNIKTELTGDALPTIFGVIANILAAGMLQEMKDPDVKSQNTIRGEAMMAEYKDETSLEDSRGEPYHMGYVQP